ISAFRPKQTCRETQIVLMEFGSSLTKKITAWSPYDVTEYFQTVALEDQEIIRQVVRLPTAGTKLTMEYEVSVIEFTLLPVNDECAVARDAHYWPQGGHAVFALQMSAFDSQRKSLPEGAAKTTYAR